MDDLDNPEIILNLWYVQNVAGFVYSVRVRFYVGTGSDEEKLAFLQRFAVVDYLIARPFPVPKRLHTHLPATGAVAPVVPRQALRLLPNRIDAFEEAIKTIRDELPAQTKLDVPESPLVCITTLVGDENGNLEVVIDGEDRF